MTRRRNTHPVSLSAHSVNQKQGQMRWAWSALSGFLSPEDQAAFRAILDRTTDRLKAEHETYKAFHRAAQQPSKGSQ